MSSAAGAASESEPATYAAASHWSPAARLQCETWWTEWRDSDCSEFPPDEDSPDKLCDSGAWPPEDADASRRLFAIRLYESAERFEDAARLYVALAHDDLEATKADELTESYNSMCHTLYGTGALALVYAAPSKEVAASKLASALRQGHAAFDKIMAPHIAAASASTACLASSDPTGAPDEKSLKRPRMDKVIIGEEAATSSGPGALLVDAAVYLRRKVFEIQAASGKLDRPLFAVQKLLFYADGYSISKRGHRLFTETPKALPHGPVYGGARDFLNYLKENRRSSLIRVAPPYGALNEDTIAILDGVVKALGSYDTDSLINLTHDEMPWKVTELGELITDELMQQWFTRPLGQGVLKLIRPMMQKKTGGSAVQVAGATT